jgi:hypothetical protein
MIIVHADSEAKAQELNNHVNSGKDVFMLIYMVVMRRVQNGPN